MTILLLVAGIALLVCALVDVVWTALWADGGSGPLSGRLTRTIWRALRRLVSRWDRAMSLAGPVAIVGTLLMWVSLLWAGWVLVFASDQGALVAQDGSAATWTDRVFFVATSMFTMGNGLTPADGVWQVVTALANATGMVVVTLGVTYVLSVMTAVARKRAFADSVNGMARSPEDMAVAAWDGTDFSRLDPVLNSVTSQLSTIAEDHKVFPVLHFVHASDRSVAAVVAVATVDEALTLIELGTPDPRCNPLAYRAARSSVAQFHSSLDSGYLRIPDEAPAAPDLSRLAAAGIPTVGRDEFHRGIDELSDRRRRLLGAVLEDGWEWRPDAPH